MYFECIKKKQLCVCVCVCVFSPWFLKTLTLTIVLSEFNTEQTCNKNKTETRPVQRCSSEACNHS